MFILTCLMDLENKETLSYDELSRLSTSHATSSHSLTFVTELSWLTSREYHEVT